jgi:hypothetical protein
MSIFKNQLMNSVMPQSQALGARQHRASHEFPRTDVLSINVPVVEGLKTGQRGLVLIPPGLVENIDGSFNTGGNFSSVALRKFVLFWDRLEVPENNVMEIGFNVAEIEYLKSCDVLQRTRVQMQGRFDGLEPIKIANKTVFKKLDQTNPGVWSIVSDANNVIFTDDEVSDGSGVSFKLYNALSIPEGDVPLNDILEFKSKRNDQLVSLRHHLDDVYQKILASPDRPLAEITEIERLDKNIADYNKVIAETGFSLLKINLQANFSVSKAFAAAILINQTGLPHSAAATGGLVAGFFDVSIGMGLKRRRETATPFQYIHSLGKEV